MWNKYIIEDKDEERSPNMSTQKQELYHVIETLPEELAVDRKSTRLNSSH